MLPTRSYRRYNSIDRERIVDAALKLEDWGLLAASMGVNYKTAYSWVLSGKNNIERRGSKKPKSLTNDEINEMITWLEESPTITLKSLKAKVFTNFRKHVSVTTVGNYLNGKLFTFKSLHYQPCAMNNIINKTKRAEYVHKLNEFIRMEKHVVWVDETNFNLFCRRTRGRAVSGSRAVLQLPTSKGPNVHVIGAISTYGVLTMDRRRGAFRSSNANEWMREVFQKWRHLGNSLEDLVVVCDNAPAHCKLEEVFVGTGATLLRLAPYSPMLNPIENIWSKLKNYVKSNMGVPIVFPPSMGEQRLQYLESMIDEAKLTVTIIDCGRSIQHSSTFHEAVIALGDMPVGS